MREKRGVLMPIFGGNMAHLLSGENIYSSKMSSRGKTYVLFLFFFFYFYFYNKVSQSDN